MHKEDLKENLRSLESILSQKIDPTEKMSGWTRYASIIRTIFPAVASAFGEGREDLAIHVSRHANRVFGGLIRSHIKPDKDSFITIEIDTAPKSYRLIEAGFFYDLLTGVSKKATDVVDPYDIYSIVESETYRLRMSHPYIGMDINEADVVSLADEAIGALSYILYAPSVSKERALSVILAAYSPGNDSLSS